jgi:hypothetical protein
VKYFSTEIITENEQSVHDDTLRNNADVEISKHPGLDKWTPVMKDTSRIITYAFLGPVRNKHLWVCIQLW